MKPIIQVQKLVKHYSLGSTIVLALRGIDLEVARGEFMAVMGPSGSGKSTFMNLLGCLDRPTSGSYTLDGVLVSQMSSDELANVRNRKIGFVFQNFNLLPRMDALNNVALPLLYSGMPPEQRRKLALQALALVGLSSRTHHRPAQLSGGQQQRVAIARALITAPAVILADEPTGNLDSRTSAQIMTLLQRLNALGMTIVIVTHEPDIANYCRRKVMFRDGRVVSDTAHPAPADATTITAVATPQPLLPRPTS
jgi:putative ABC transport system ATP-binding protein